MTGEFAGGGLETLDTRTVRTSNEARADAFRVAAQAAIEAPPPPPKNIVVCLDGTNNLLDDHPTNAAKIFKMLDLDHPKAQIAYYDPGVGTLPSSGAVGKIAKLSSKLGGLAFGFGMKTNITQAYAWLMDRYRPGDRVYIFGFSRGAFTARALAALLGRPGMLRAGSDNLVEYAIKEYTKPARTDKAKKIRNREAKAFADALCWGTKKDPAAAPSGRPVDDFCVDLGAKDCHAVPVHYLGIWDTVEAWFGGIGKLDWADTDELWNVDRVRHAVAIDEWRLQFKPSRVDAANPRFEEAWFAGVHCDVGGTFGNYDLARIALKWVFEGAGHDLMLRNGEWKKRYETYCSVVDAFGLNKEGKLQNPVNKDPWGYHLISFGQGRRTIPAGASVHASVRARLDADPGYRPRWEKPNDPVRWVDEDWTVFVPPPAAKNQAAT